MGILGAWRLHFLTHSGHWDGRRAVAPGGASATLSLLRFHRDPGETVNGLSYLRAR